MHGHHKSAIPAHQAPISHALNASYSVKPLVSPIPLPHYRFPSSFLTPSPPFPFSQLFDISDPEKSFMQMTGHYTDIDIPRCCCRATSRFLARNLLYLSFITRPSFLSLSFSARIFIFFAAFRVTSSTASIARGKKYMFFERYVDF